MCLFMLLLTLAAISPLFHDSSRDFRSRAQNAYSTPTRTRTPTLRATRTPTIRCGGWSNRCGSGYPPCCSNSNLYCQNNYGGLGISGCNYRATPTRTRTPTRGASPTRTRTPTTTCLPDGRRCFVGDPVKGRCCGSSYCADIGTSEPNEGVCTSCVGFGDRCVPSDPQRNRCCGGMYCKVLGEDDGVCQFY